MTWNQALKKARKSYISQKGGQLFPNWRVFSKHVSSPIGEFFQNMSLPQLKDRINQTLPQLESFFRTCLRPDLRHMCEYNKYVRIHSMDIRGGAFLDIKYNWDYLPTAIQIIENKKEGSKILLIDFFHNFFRSMFMKDIGSIWNIIINMKDIVLEYIEYYHKLLVQVGTLLKKKDVAFIITDLMKNYSIKKQFEKSWLTKNQKDKLLRYLILPVQEGLKQEISDKYFSNLLGLNLYSLIRVAREDNDKLKKLWNLMKDRLLINVDLTKTIARVTDIYAMFRMFKIFGGMTFNPSKHRNMIFYVGDAHARNYFNALQSALDFELIYEIPCDKFKTKCLKIDKRFQLPQFGDKSLDKNEECEFFKLPT